MFTFFEYLVYIIIFDEWLNKRTITNYYETSVTLEEKYLIEGLKSKDKVVFDFIFNYYYSGLCAYSLKYLPDNSTVEDIVQDFFVALWMNSQNLSITTSLRSYLFVSVKNRCLDYKKHHKIQEKYKKSSLFRFNETEESNYNRYIESELRDAIFTGMEKLPPRCREIFKMSRFNGLKNKEIAEKLTISKRTVELQISLALKTLRVELKEFLPAFLIAWLLG